MTDSGQPSGVGWPDKPRDPQAQAPADAIPQLSLADLVLRHRTTILAVVVPGLIVMRLLVIAHGDLATAQAMAVASGLGDLVVPLLLASLPIVSGLLFAVSLIDFNEHLREEDPIGVTAFSTVVTGILAVALVPVGFLVSIVIVGFVMTASSLLMRFGRRFFLSRGRSVPEWLRRLPASRRTLAAQVVSLGVLALLIFGASDRPWLPAEQVTWKAGGRSVVHVGYVVSVSDGKVFFLEHEPRRILILDAEEVQSRQICRPRGASSGRSLAAVLAWGSDSSVIECR